MTKILLVDDVKEVHELVHLCLRDIKDRDIVDAFSGAEALRVLGVDNPEPLSTGAPDVILLDIEMPGGLNGLEVCKKIRHREEYKNTPIIFLTQHQDVAYQTQALEMGVSGYIVKPFPKELVAATVDSAIKHKRLTDEVEKLIEHKTGLTSMLVHDINNYIGTILMSVDLGLEENDLAKFHNRFLVIKRSMLEIKKMTSGLLDIEKLESKTLPIALEGLDGWHLLFQRASQIFSGVGQGKVSVRLMAPAGRARVIADRDVLDRVFDNLLHNAFKFAPAGSVLELGAFMGEGVWNFYVENDGPAIDKKFHKKIFEKFGQLETRKEIPNKGFGLGLTYCRLALETMQGRITIESPTRWEDGEPRGVRFIVSLPGWI
jgi:signal transduction histidine kinase